MKPAAINPDPRLRVLYLLAIGVGVFVLREPWQLGCVVALQAALWLGAGLGARALGRQLWKLWLLSLFFVVTYALFENDPATDRWVRYTVLGLTVPINLSGALEGVLMVVRLLCVVMGSQVARAGDPRAISAGLDRLRVPRVIALSLDVVLALLGDGGGRGRGMGGGGGGGRGGGKGGHQDEAAEPFFASVKRLAKGDVAPIVDKIDKQIRRAEAHAKKSGFQDAALLRDVSVIAGMSLTMLAIKMLKVLPSLPFAPGHKLVVLTPLYIVAAVLTRSRFGATLTGLTMGTVAFLMGDGRYGVFELLKHIAPGLIADALVPLLMRKEPLPGGFAWSLCGAAIGIGRFATIFLVTVSLQPPAVAFAFLVPGLVLNVFFGVMSGWISYHLVRAVARLREPRQEERGSDDDEAGDGRRPDPHRVEPDEGVAAGSGSSEKDGEPARVSDHAGRGAGRHRRPIDLR